VFNFKEIKKILQNDIFIEMLSKETKYDVILLTNYINTSIEEAQHTINMLSSYNLKDKRILEFGSGLGFASIMLHLKGYEITSFEPGGLGFEKNILVNRYIKQHFNLEFNFINDINMINTNSFDFIFSNNVLEHIDNVEKIILKLNNCLTHEGIMIHNIPNYIIPYEPHFCIPFFPIFPKKMSFIIPGHITSTDLWKSLNFINIFDVKSYAKKAHATVKFEKQLLYKTIMRMEKDKIFFQRHQNLSQIINIIKALGLLKFIKLLPASLNTPMVFEWRKND